MLAIGSNVRSRFGTIVFGLWVALAATSCGHRRSPGELSLGDAAADLASEGPADVAIPSDSIIVFTCGNGVIDLGEQCDDSNRVPSDGCTVLCQLAERAVCPAPGQPCHFLPTCGDGVILAGEACDDGNIQSGDGCSADCAVVEPGWRCPVPGRRCVPICGDGHLIGSETCEDGNTVDGDGCSSTCLVEPGCVCQPGGCSCTMCGDGGTAGGASCDVPRCGDSIASGAEQCDDGAANADGAYGGCTPQCKYGAFCGDGVVNGPEACDLGTFSNVGRYGDESGCTSACLASRYCGDGIVDAEFEQCDFGSQNGTLGAACSTACRLYLR